MGWNCEIVLLNRPAVSVSTVARIGESTQSRVKKDEHRNQSVRDEKKERNAAACLLIVARVLCNLIVSWHDHCHTGGHCIGHIILLQ